MTQETDTNDYRLNTITQMLRKWDLIKLTDVQIDNLQEIELRHLRMAFQGGQSNALTFDEWFNKTFITKEK
jgi:hypothetical protein